MRKILVLGGTGDIGQAIVQMFAQDVVISTGSENCDLYNPGSVQRFIEHNKDFDVIVHCAGSNNPKQFEQLTTDEIDSNIQINLLGFLPIVQSNIDYWRSTGNGKLVIISSLYGQYGRQGRLPYSISKHGLVAVTKTLSIELAAIGVMVNAVSPGYIETKMTSKNNTPEIIARLTAGIPVGRMGKPKEIASLVKFLASEDNTYITGQDIVVDGGYTAGGFQQ